MSDVNNSIYRYLRAAYELRSDDCRALWNAAGYDLSNSQLRGMMVSPDNDDYNKIASRRLKVWLRELLKNQGLVVPGMSIDMQVSALAESVGLTPSNDPEIDAKEIRNSLRGVDWND